MRMHYPPPSVHQRSAVITPLHKGKNVPGLNNQRSQPRSGVERLRETWQAKDGQVRDGAPRKAGWRRAVAYPLGGSREMLPVFFWLWFNGFRHSATSGKSAGAMCGDLTWGCSCPMVVALSTGSLRPSSCG